LQGSLPLRFPLDPFPSFLGRVGQESSGDGGFWLRADKPVNKFSILEDEHGWNTLNLKLSSRARIFIDIQLGHAVTTIRLGSELVHDWAHHAAGSAPGSPTIQQDWPAIDFQHLALKGGISHYQRFCFVGSFYCFAHIERRATFATSRDLFSGIPRVEPILSPTVAANYNRHFVLPSKLQEVWVVGQFGVSEIDCLTEPSSFARLRQADNFDKTRSSRINNLRASF
jgi:hypothetical protein